MIQEIMRYSILCIEGDIDVEMMTTKIRKWVKVVQVYAKKTGKSIFEKSRLYDFYPCKKNNQFWSLIKHYDIVEFVQLV